MTLMGNPTRFLLLALALGGCASAPSTPINTVARGDLACDQVNVNEVADNRYQAAGCGRTGTYAKLCSGRHCSWVRVRSPNEVQQQSSGGYAASTYGQRQIVPAPPPAPREVIQAPPPAQREIIPAPPPETQAAAPAADAQQAPQPAYTPQPTPLSQGELSQPYQAEVPLEATTQRVQYPPPAPLVEVRPVAPQPNYVWVGGYWWWGNPAWTWVPGYWCAPRFGYSYIASSWYWNSGSWYFGPGGWARPGSTIIVSGVGARPNRFVTSRSFTPNYVASSGGRMGTGPAYAPSYNSPMARSPQRFTPSPSPMYQYPTSSSQRMGRMGTSQGGPQRMGGYNGVSSSAGPQRFGAGSTTTSQRNYGYQPGRMGGQSGMSRMNSGPVSAPPSSYRSTPMMRMPSSSPGPSRFGGGGGGGSFGRMGGGGGGGGSFGRMGGGGGGGGPARSAGGGR